MELVEESFNSLPLTQLGQERFSTRQLSLIIKGPKQSTPVDQKGGLRRRKRAGGKSANLGTVALAHHL
jgi:hypothetical protein